MTFRRMSVPGLSRLTLLRVMFLKGYSVAGVSRLYGYLQARENLR
jgi:hypothetical protein